MSLVLPKSTVNLIDRVTNCQRHPGLLLDKFSVPGDQQAQKRALDALCRIPGDSALLDSLSTRRRHAVGSLPEPTVFRCETTAALTLHLSRASALENAGICPHPLYGFAYLPGSGLKGMARAYAETLWLPTQYRTAAADTLAPEDEGERKKAAAAWRLIEDVFGWAPDPQRKRQIRNKDHPATARRRDDGNDGSPEIGASVGSIVFHDAWPTTWPKLIVDIVNNHHPDYYQHDDNNHPPGDWEDPVPVYFLAVKPETTFSFALSKRRTDVPDDLLSLARQWLLGALCHFGAGAKTNAGYGAFRPAENVDEVLPSAVDETWNVAVGMSPDAPKGPVPVPPGHPRRAVFETTLELVTPAFLAGAEQYGEAAKDGCDLRPATLRGHLRWWWRTMHAGFLDVKTLRALEAAIWGDTCAAGAVRILIEHTDEQVDATVVHAYDKRSKADFNQQQKRSGHGIPNADPRKTTQGLWYASYGMDEGRQNNRRQRHVLEPPAWWPVRLIARSTRYFTNRADAADQNSHDRGSPITAQQALSQAKAALWLLCRFGAVGSKARKGFGSLAADALDDCTLPQCREAAEQLRAALRLRTSFTEHQAHSSSLCKMLHPVEVTFSWPDVWQVLDQVGFAYQAFAKKYKHMREKMALGLPRCIGNPVQGTFNPRLLVTTNSRHSSPVHIHIARSDGGWLVRAVAFPAAHLPNLNVSTTFLKEFLRDFGNDLQRRAKLKPPPSRPTQASRVQRQQASVATAQPNLPSAGDRVEAILLEEKTKKGGWRARHEPTGLNGPVNNTADVPADKKPGDKLTLIVASANEREIAFRYPTDTDEQRAKRPRGPRERTPRGTGVTR